MKNALKTVMLLTVIVLAISSVSAAGYFTYLDYSNNLCRYSDGSSKAPTTFNDYLCSGGNENTNGLPTGTTTSFHACQGGGWACPDYNGGTSYYNILYCSADSSSDFVTCSQGCNAATGLCNEGLRVCTEGYMQCGLGDTADTYGDPYKCVNNQWVKQTTCNGVCYEQQYNNAVCYSQSKIYCSNEVKVGSTFCDGIISKKCNFYDGTGARFLLDSPSVGYIRQNPTSTYTNNQYSTIQTCSYQCSAGSCVNPPAPTCNIQALDNPTCSGSNIIQTWQRSDCSTEIRTLQQCSATQTCQGNMCIDNPVTPPINDTPIVNNTQPPTCAEGWFNFPSCSGNSVVQDWQKIDCSFESRTKNNCQSSESCQNGACTPLICPTLPTPSEWNSCSNDTRTRTNYRCDMATNYQVSSFNETTNCQAPVNNSLNPTLLIGLIAVAGVLVIVTIFIYVRRR